MTEQEVDKAFREVIADTQKMKEIGISRSHLYKFRNPDQQKTGLAKKLEILFRCGKLQLK